MVSSSDATAGPLHLQLPRRKEGRKHVEVKERRVTPVVPHAEHARAPGMAEKGTESEAPDRRTTDRDKNTVLHFLAFCKLSHKSQSRKSPPDPPLMYSKFSSTSLLVVRPFIFPNK